MLIKFKINYRTQIGQILKITGSIPQLGSNVIENAAEMFPVDGFKGDWDCIIDIPENAKMKNFSYKYFLEDINSKNRYFEWGENRIIDISEIISKKIEINDFWISSTEPDNVFYSSAFKNVLFTRKIQKNKKTIATKEKNTNLVFNLTDLRIRHDHSYALVGNIKELGNWDLTKCLLLEANNYPTWSLSLDIKKFTSPIIYRYCIVNTKTKEIVAQEYQDRIINFDETDNKNLALIANDLKFKHSAGNWKGAGVAIPVFSIRTKNSHGVGEFLDIKLLVDWAVKTGMKLIQILPINDTVATHTWVDSYPYAAISVFALHPIYLNLNAIGKLSSKITQQIIDEQRKMMNEKDRVDYEAVMKIKSRFYKLIYDEQKDEFLKNTDFLKFYKENKYWLDPYACFSYLRDLFGTPDFTKWGKYSKPTKKIITELTDSNASHYDDIAVHYFIQYHLHIQLLEASEYARSKGIVLKGDIPIGIFRHSVDAWIEPHLYNMDAQAGAPPDDFADIGQNWKFPTYNWAEMAKDNYQWWQNRLKKMSCYFDAYRIDHILGFFRIWEIPQNQVQGIMGYFNPSIPIYQNEFYERGLNFDFFRFCSPFIRDYMLYDIFGDLTDFVKGSILVEYEPGKFYIKEDFDSQSKIEQYLAISESDTPQERLRKERIQNGMFRLLSEVLFLKYPHSDQETYIPRHSLNKTYSFAALTDYEKNQVMQLYIDYYFRRNEEFWKKQAMIKLPAIKNATDMLVCGEDLGMVPKVVPQVMNELGILSLEIQRMPKKTDVEFMHPNDYPYMSVATPSSHDTSTIRGWWEEDTSRSQRFYSHILGKWENSPFFCEPWIVKEIINQHIYSPSMWVVFPIQDLLGMDDKLRYTYAKEERINNPANPRHYWRYRLHLNIEDLLKQDEFNEMLKDMFEKSGRVEDY